MQPGDLSAYNTAEWAKGDLVDHYVVTDLWVAEAIVLARHGAALREAVLELGCGTGRITRVLAALSDDVLALDVSDRMVEACRRNVPGARVERRDLRDLSPLADGAFGAVVGAANVLGILTHADRLTALGELHRLLRPEGTLIFSAHNLAFRPGAPPARTPAQTVKHLLKRPRELANRRRATAYEEAGPDYALVTDGVHEHRLTHYHLGRDAQERQLAAAGFALQEVWDDRGRRVAPGEAAPGSGDLYYVARRRP